MSDTVAEVRSDARATDAELTDWVRRRFGHEPLNIEHGGIVTIAVAVPDVGGLRVRGSSAWTLRDWERFAMVGE